jgi:hypothetical protein
VFNIPCHDLINEFIIRSGLFADRRFVLAPNPCSASLQKIEDSQDAFPFISPEIFSILPKKKVLSIIIIESSENYCTLS